MKKGRLAINTRGFTTVEALLAASVFGLIVTALVGALIYGLQSMAVSGEQSRAADLTREGIEAVRSIRDDDVTNIAAGTYGLALVGNEWTFSGSSDTTDIFTRQVVISNVATGIYEVACTVTWQQTLQRSGTITFTSYITYWEAPDTTAPGDVSDLATSGPTTTTVDLSWTAPGDDGNSLTATSYDVRYSTSDITNLTQWTAATQATGEPAPSVAGTTENMTVTGLSPGTTYYFAIRTSDEVPNESGTSNRPTATTVSAADTTPPAAVADLATSGATTTTVDLDWTAPGDDGNSGTATTYDVRYSTATIDEGNWAAATPATGEPSPSIAGSAESMTVSGLTASTTYYFAIKTNDEVPNVSAISNVPSATTSAIPDTTPPADVSDLATGAVTSTSIDLSWTAPGDDGAVGTATTYDVRYATSDINNEVQWAAATQATGEPAPSVAGTTENMTVTGLSPGTTYYFVMKTSDEVPNTSGRSNRPNATTASGADTTPPDAVSDLALSGETTSSVDLAWTAPGDDGATGTATTYDVRYSTSAIDDGNWAAATQATGEPSPSVAGTSESMTVSGLAGSTTYYFAIKTSDEVPNVSGLSNVPNTATLGDTTPPDAVADLALSGETQTSVNLAWTAPGDDGATGTATTYDVRYSTAAINDGNWAAATQATGEPSPSVAGSSESMTVGSLSPNTTYYFAIKTSDEVPNESSLSNVPSTTTLAANQSDSLSIDTSSAAIDGGDTSHVIGITIQNTGGGDIVLDTMTVSWTGGGGGSKLKEININTNTLWTGNGSSGQVSDLSPNFTLVSGAGAYPITFLEWSKAMTGLTLNLTFTMSDASTKSVTGITP
ncbi:fibronectin type III domain-containing protein [Patescibacteria group bacterium]